MENLKTYGSLLISFLCAFILGLYVSSEVKLHEHVEIHRWILTSVFGLFFLIIFIDRLKNE